MRENPFRQEREEMKQLLKEYYNFKLGKKFNFIEEEAFERIIDYFDENENLALAMEAANFATDQFPYSASLLIKKADILIASQHYSEALDVLEKAEIFDHTDVNIYILKTDVYLALDLHEKAASLLEEALLTFEGEEKIEMLFELADVYDDYENFNKVFDCLKLLLEQDPTNEEALYKICFWTDFTNRNEESIALHQEIINEHPYCQLAWFNLGAAYQGEKLYEKSIDAYLYAVAIDEKFDFAYRNLGDAYLRLRKYKDAIEVLQKVLELSMPEGVIFEAIGHCYEKLKNPAQARFHYRKAVHLNDLDSHLYYKIALTYVLENQWESAIKNLNSALSIHRNKPDFHLALALCYSEIDKTKEAVLHFSQFIKMRPKNVKGWKELIKFLYQADYLEDALTQVKNAQISTNDKPIFLFYRAAILFALGKSKEALLFLETGLKQAPNLVKQMIQLDSSLLQNYSIIELIIASKPAKRK
ncbi:MAG: tetratricopeptide repeat protein [Ginsengibacter sp.]